MSDNQKRNLFEGMDVGGKLLLTSICSSLLGRPTSTNVVGSRSDLQIAFKMITATQKFHEVLMHPNVSLGNLRPLLQEKIETAKEFERVWGVPWPL